MKFIEKFIRPHWEKKLMALQSLDGFDHGTSRLRAELPREKYKWACIIPGDFLSANGITCGNAGYGNSPEEAVNDAWLKIEDFTSHRNCVLKVTNHFGTKYLKLVGYTFKEAKDYEISEN